MLTMELGGVRFRLDPAAISAIRYRAEYGDSVLNHLLDAGSAQELEGCLLRMCHQMIPPAERPEILEFARQARADGDFFSKALVAKAALLDVDTKAPVGRDDEGRQAFDEYDVLVGMATAQIDTGLIHELPIFHLAGLISRYAESRESGAENHKLSDKEFETLFPRRGYTEQRIAAIKAEQKAEEDRLNALIDGIDEEIAARKRLRQVESDDDAVAKAQKVLEAAQFQLTFARDENTRREMEKEVTRAQQALDKALQSKADNDFYYAKEQEKDALRDQLDDVREKYQGQIDNAPAWAEQRVSAIEAAEERRARAEEEARRKDQEKWEQEQATMQTIQKAATGALAAAGKVVTQITTAITKVTNHNSVSVTTGASMLTTGQMARAMEKAIEKMAK